MVQAELPPQALESSTKLILSVDDDPFLLYTRQRVLEGEGYTVLSAGDGATALKIFTE